MHRWSIMVALTTIVLLQTGCVLAPVSRTYFEPNPADGTPTRSGSCGYHRAANDGLRRDFNGVRVSVFPFYEKDRPLRLVVFLERDGRTFRFDPNTVRLVVNASPPPLEPTSIDAGRGSGTYSRGITFTFPEGAAKANDISVEIQSGLVIVDGAPSEAATFRFRKVTKSDVYYNSINC